ncbi:hypothetical protein GC173_04560 [bacterium]|nr:hypothetical protein [bacterium]
MNPIPLDMPPPTLAELYWLPPLMYWLWVAVCGMFGLFFGSFFNVAIYRVPAGLSVNEPKRSFCFRCGSQIRWYENLPVLSWFILGGRCGRCGSPFSLRYAGIELLTALIFIAVFLGANPPGSPSFDWATLWYLAFASLLLVGTFTDLDHWIIPDGVTVGGTVAALVAALALGFAGQWTLLSEFGPFPVLRHHWGEDGFSLFVMMIQGPDKLDLEPAILHRWEPFANAVLGAVFGWSMLYSVGVAGKLIAGKEAMGYGDVKLFAMIGATLGVTGALATFVLACLIGTLIGGGPMIVHRVMALADRLRGRRPAQRPTLLQKGLELFPVEESDESGPAQLVRRHRVWLEEHGSPRQLHHMPFGPSIALAALLVVIFQHPIRDGLAKWIF